MPMLMPKSASGREDASPLNSNGHPDIDAMISFAAAARIHVHMCMHDGGTYYLHMVRANAPERRRQSKGTRGSRTTQNFSLGCCIVRVIGIKFMTGVVI